MIRLKALLEDLDDERSIWRTKDGRWGAENTAGQIRYFKDQETATKFARGEIKGPHPGRPEPKERPQRHDRKEPRRY